MSRKPRLPVLLFLFLFVLFKNFQFRKDKAAKNQVPPFQKINPEVPFSLLLVGKRKALTFAPLQTQASSSTSVTHVYTEKKKEEKKNKHERYS